jgi:hypothetical protein
VVPEEEVGEASTEPEVAAVEYEDTTGDRSTVDGVGDAVSEEELPRSSTNLEAAIASRIGLSSPRPAWSQFEAVRLCRSVLVDGQPEARDVLWREGDRILRTHLGTSISDLHPRPSYRSAGDLCVVYYLLSPPFLNIMK